MSIDEFHDGGRHERTIFAKFIETDIFAEMGRLFYSLLNAFATNGYTILLFDNIPAAALNKYGPLVYTLDGLSKTDAIPLDARDMIYLFDKEDQVAAMRKWGRRVQVKFDVFAPYWLGDPVMMPYPMHPLNAGRNVSRDLQALRNTDRRIRIFFSGDIEGYTRNRIRYPRPKLTRLDIVNTIRERLGERLHVVANEPALECACVRGGGPQEFVMADPRSFRVDSGKWLETISRADFFLCPPGYVMPMCHNAVEAMAVGTIPIINYPEWFKPSLEHTETCIAFDERDDLIAKLREVLEMGDDRVAAMRRRVVDYYEKHLTAESFVAKVEADRAHKTIVLIVTDANTARNATELGRHSILIRDHNPSWAKWLRSLRGALSG